VQEVDFVVGELAAPNGLDDHRVTLGRGSIDSRPDSRLTGTPHSVI
jgi:hypothetical protein